MAILTKKEILKKIRSKEVKIAPFSASQIGPASIDLTLSGEFRVFKDREMISIVEGADYKKHTKKIVAKSFVLKPQQMVLGITKERITLPANICGSLSGRSRFARLGLTVHMTASFIQPGIDNREVLEIYNASHNPLKLVAGERVCQLILHTTEGSERYKGKFRRQSL